MGRRVEKTYKIYSGGWRVQSGYPIRFVYDGWNPVLVFKSDNSVKYKLTWGLDLSQSIHGAGGIGGLLACEEPQTVGDPKRYWFMYDANGNVGQVLDATDTSNITIAARYEYDPYGNPIPIPQPPGPGPQADLNPIRFSTKWFDDETDLGYWGYRYYSPRLGRWISRDPIGEKGGLNLLNYVRNHPCAYVDKLGLWLFCDAFGCHEMPDGPPNPPPSPPRPPPPPEYDVVLSGHGCFQSEGETEPGGAKSKCRICEDPTYVPEYLGNPNCDNPLTSTDVVAAVRAAGASFPTTVWLGHCGAGKMSDRDLDRFAINMLPANGPVGEPYSAIKRICGCKGNYYYFWITGYCFGGWKCVDVQ